MGLYDSGDDKKGLSGSPMSGLREASDPWRVWGLQVCRLSSESNSISRSAENCGGSRKAAVKDPMYLMASRRVVIFVNFSPWLLVLFDGAEAQWGTHRLRASKAWFISRILLLSRALAVLRLYLLKGADRGLEEGLARDSEFGPVAEAVVLLSLLVLPLGLSWYLSALRPPSLEPRLPLLLASGNRRWPLKLNCIIIWSMILFSFALRSENVQYRAIGSCSPFWSECSSIFVCAFLSATASLNLRKKNDTR